MYDGNMNKLLRIIFSIVFIVCSLALCVLCFSLISPVVNWPLLIPVVITAIGLFVIAWQIASGATWRDIMEFIVDTFFWR